MEEHGLGLQAVLALCVRRELAVQMLVQSQAHLVLAVCQARTHNRDRLLALFVLPERAL